ncbi:hypothetical protein P152DRAFT_463463 [Eremomyces bilateralis CBS 781.70]|uniref:Uncharacterized protein n=1 Tax=Eremomyces bilateralis CBS 781.70 TaxID=1392243 RepID=A0A6G1GH52_9PEZI|nr:uncharacterized protein P152DRAFT_463463 [Eremomyces bilateralis CBS 781.70]KAF1817231.1 hypothetical protein P152DRAFT_463463 [Eremomyces bilateralis CBS 781.70]
MSATSASVTRNTPKSSKSSSKRRNTSSQANSRSASSAGAENDQVPRPNTRRESIMLMDQQVIPNASTLSLGHPPRNTNGSPNNHSSPHLPPVPAPDRAAYDERLTTSIWALATQNAQPVLDLLVCLERNQPIGFRYVDINKPVVIHHGSKDSRVPVENVRWLGRTMRRCEVRILEGEAHGLMGSAGVMSRVLTEMAGEWEDWTRLVREGGIGEGV